MRRRFPERKPKRYSWFTSRGIVEVDASSVAVQELLRGSDYQQGQGTIVHEERTCNIIRIVGDALFQYEAALLDDVTDHMSYGSVIWGIVVVDEDELLAPTFVFDPDSDGVDDERVLALGMTDGFGVIMDVNAQVGGTGLVTSYGSTVPFSQRVHFDIRSNRRIGVDDQVLFVWTRSNTSNDLNTGVEVQGKVIARTLIKLP